mgnify:CR=1 FL=1
MALAVAEEVQFNADGSIASSGKVYTKAHMKVHMKGSYEVRSEVHMKSATFHMKSSYEPPVFSESRCGSSYETFI